MLITTEASHNVLCKVVNFIIREIPVSETCLIYERRKNQFLYALYPEQPKKTDEYDILVLSLSDDLETYLLEMAGVAVEFLHNLPDVMVKCRTGEITSHTEQFNSVIQLQYQIG